MFAAHLKTLSCLLAATLILSTSQAQPSSFIYQGRLRENGLPASGVYDLTFSLYPTNSGGNPVGGIVITNAGLIVSNGIFSTRLDFGRVFDGRPYWLEIAVATNAGTEFVVLDPRQNLAATPYSMHAASASSLEGVLSDNQISNNVPRLTYPTNTFHGTVIASSYRGDGSGLTGVITTNNLTFPNTIFVNKAGNDDMGERQRLDRPYLTLAAARTAALPGDTIMVYPGTYSGIDLLKDGVHWFFYDGATNNYIGPIADKFIFGDNGHASTSSVAGAGTFIYSCPSGLGSPSGVVGITHSNSVFHFQAKDIILNRDDGDGTSALVYGVYVTNCRQVYGRCHSITVSLSDSAATPVWWERGDEYLDVDYIRSQQSWAVWTSEDINLAGYPETSLYLVSKVIESPLGGVWFYPYTAKGKLWMTVQEIRAGSDQAILYTPGTPSGSGKLYVTAQKVSNTGLAKSAIEMESAGGGQMWLTIQKVSSKFRFLTLASGTNYASIDHFEQTGSITNGINLSGGVSFIRGQTLQISNGTGIVYNGGKARVDGYTITAPTPVSLLSPANLLRLKDCVLLATGTNASIASTGSRKVGIYGHVMANTGKGADVTLSPLGTFTVDANLP